MIRTCERSLSGHVSRFLLVHWRFSHLHIMLTITLQWGVNYNVENYKLYTVDWEVTKHPLFTADHPPVLKWGFINCIWSWRRSKFIVIGKQPIFTTTTWKILQSHWWLECEYCIYLNKESNKGFKHWVGKCKHAISVFFNSHFPWWPCSQADQW